MVSGGGRGGRVGVVVVVGEDGDCEAGWEGGEVEVGEGVDEGGMNEGVATAGWAVNVLVREPGIMMKSRMQRV